MMRQSRALLLLTIAGAWPAVGRAETGYDLWLRYVRSWTTATRRPPIAQAVTAIVAPDAVADGRGGPAPSCARGLGGLLGVEVPVSAAVGRRRARRGHARRLAAHRRARAGPDDAGRGWATRAT